MRKNDKFGNIMLSTTTPRKHAPLSQLQQLQALLHAADLHLSHVLQEHASIVGVLAQLQGLAARLEQIVNIFHIDLDKRHVDRVRVFPA